MTEQRHIILTIKAGEKNCDDCIHLEHFSTGLAGEWHMKCVIFGKNGPWRKENMARDPKCRTAEKTWMRRYYKYNSRCEWKHDYETGCYDTSCGEYWQFIESGAKENGVVYCHKCGKLVTIIPDSAGCKEE